MLFIYMLDNHPQYSNRVLELLRRSRERRDTLHTSYLALGEVLAGAAKSGNPAKVKQIRSVLDASGFSYLPFGDKAVNHFAYVRSRSRIHVADAIHLACAAAAGIDLFLTGDKQLIGMYVPGVQFIADFNAQIL